ncbi:MAG: translocation/assembly module TamB domain-containing protein [Bacteroidetes bacterium]|nr:translocation/assembly module TamB domain-containing protein [Bacteroidota bacterium]
MGKYLKKITKIIAWTVGSVLLLLLFINLSIRIPAVQNFLVQKVVNTLSEQTGAEITLDHILISFPQTIVVEGLYVEDLQKDTLAYIGELRVNAALWGLLRNKIHIRQVKISTTTAHISRPKNDTAFNFSFIAEALSSGSTDTIPADTKSAKWQFSIDQVSLQNVQFSFIDSTGGINLKTNFGKFDIDINKLNLDTLALDIDEIDLENSDLAVAFFGTPQPTDNGSGSALPEINLNTVHFENVSFEMEDAVSQMNLKTQTGSLDLEFKDIDLNKQIVDLHQLAYQNSTVYFNFYSPATTDSVTTDASTNNTTSWEVSLGELDISEFDFRMNNIAYPDSIHGFDPNHISVEGMNLQSEALYYKGMDIRTHIARLDFSETHGFNLRELTGNFALSDTSASFRDFVLKTDGSAFSQETTLFFPAIDQITAHPDSVRIVSNLEVSKFDPADIDFFVPGWRDSVPLNIDSLQPLFFAFSLEGSLSDLDIAAFRIELLDSTQLTLKGKVAGLPETKNLQIGFAELQFTTTHTNLAKMGIDSMIPENIALPANIGLSARLDNNASAMNTQASLTTNFGNVKIDGQLLLPQNGDTSYRFVLKTDAFQTGRLLKDTTSYGLLTMQVDAKGQSFDLMNMHTDVKIEIGALEYMGHIYQDIILNTSADEGTFTLDGVIEDQYVDLSLDGQFMYDTLTPQIDLTLDLKGINLQKLGFSQEDIRARGKLVAHLRGSNASNLNGRIDTRDILIIKNGERYPIDSLIFVSINDSVRTEVNINSDFLAAKYAGSLKIDKVSRALTHHINRYFAMDHDTSYIPGNNNFELSVDLKSSALLTQVLVPGLEKLDPGTIESSFDELNDQFDLKINLSLIGYQGNRLKNLNINVTSGDPSLQSSVELSQLEIAGYFLSGISLGATLSDNALNGSLNMQTTDRAIAYQIPFKLRQADSVYLLSFPDKKVIINSKSLQFTNDDEIQLSELASGHYTMELTSGEERIKLEGMGDRFKAGLTHFSLANIGNLLKTTSGDTLLNGYADGYLVLTKATHFDSIRAKFTLRDVQILENSLGNIQIDLHRNDPSFMSGNLRIGKGNDILADLNKIPLDTTQQLDANITINRFGLSTIQGFLPGKSDSLSGWLSGSFELGNTLAKPLVNGKLTFNDMHAQIRSYGTFVNINGQSVQIKNNDLIFPQFTIQDNQNGSLILDGKIISDHFSNFKIDLKANASKFRAVDNPDKGDSPYQGVLVFSTNTKISGATNDIKINSGLTINSETDFEMEMPGSDPTSSSYQGVVEFVDKSQSLNPILTDSTSQEVTFSQQGLNVTANIEIEEKASLSMIMDPKAGDRLWVSGSANLTFELDDSGIPSLSGRYNLNDGGYKLTLFDITQREFKLQDGSYIIWSGDPMEARINIDATWDVKTSPYNLIADQTSSASDAETKQFRQNLPFTVILMIRGMIKSPDINFNIVLPPEKQAVFNGIVQSKLTELKAPGNESNMNKQVLALLTFKQFMPQNPLEMGGESSGLSGIARNSVSQLLSHQLNSFSEKYIKGVSVNFDLQSYDEYSNDGSMEQRTELNVGLSRSFFDNRLEVSVGSNIELESDKYKQQNNLGDIADDIEVEYKITPDGVYRTRAFRYNQYEQFEGDIIESGVSFIFNKDFNTLKQLFQKQDSVKTQKAASNEIKEKAREE